MKASEVFIVVPFSRPHFIQNVVDNIERQTVKDKIVIVVENGPAVGTYPQDKADVILKSSPSPGAAKNKAIKYINENYGNKFWTTYDDDDYYGPKYLEELIQNSDKAEVIGKISTFMHASDGSMIQIDNTMESCYVNSIWGYSISSWTHECPQFSKGKCGEDNIWIRKAITQGWKIYATSTHNSMFSRHTGKHAWNTTDEEIYQSCFGSIKRWENVNHNIVNGLEPISGYEPILDTWRVKKHSDLRVAEALDRVAEIYGKFGERI